MTSLELIKLFAYFAAETLKGPCFSVDKDVLRGSVYEATQVNKMSIVKDESDWVRCNAPNHPRKAIYSFTYVWVSC